MNWKDRFLVWLWKVIQRRTPVYDWTDYGNHVPECQAMREAVGATVVCTQDAPGCEVGRQLWRLKERIR